MNSADTLPLPRVALEATRLARLGRRCMRMARVALHVLAGMALSPLLRLDAPRLRCAVVRWWMHKLCRILNVQPHVRGPRPSRPTLLVTNHVSWLDVPVLLTVFDADFVAKSEVARWPAIGALAVGAGTIFLTRGARDAARATADRMTAQLARRRHVVFFPEATTGDGRGVRRFYARLYQAAIRTHSRVQAVALRYPQLDGAQGAAPFIDDDELLSHMWRLMGEKQIVVELSFCDPIEPAGQRRRLADRTRRQICAALDVDPQQYGPRSAKLRFPRQHAAST